MMTADQIRARLQSADVARGVAEARSLAHALRRDGLAFFRMAPDREAFRSLTASLGVIEPHTHSDADDITRIQAAGAPEGNATRRGFSTDGLFPHTDGSSSARPAAYLAQLCAENAAVGGEALFLDGTRILARLDAEAPVVRTILTRPSSVIFGDKVRFCGSILEPVGRNRLRLRFRYDDYGFYGREVASALNVLVRVIEEETVAIALPPGHGYLIDNARWLHGRRAYQGRREVWRILFNGPGPFALEAGIPTAAHAA